VRTIPVDSVIVTEHGVAALEIVDETAAPADALFRMRAQSLLTR